MEYRIAGPKLKKWQSRMLVKINAAMENAISVFSLDGRRKSNAIVSKR